MQQYAGDVVTITKSDVICQAIFPWPNLSCGVDLEAEINVWHSYWCFNKHVTTFLIHRCKLIIVNASSSLVVSKTRRYWVYERPSKTLSPAHFYVQFFILNCVFFVWWDGRRWCLGGCTRVSYPLWGTDISPSLCWLFWFFFSDYFFFKLYV